MVVGSINKSKIVFLLGYSLEQVSQRIEQFIKTCRDDNYIKEKRSINFCGNVLRCSVTDYGGQKQYTFVMEDDDVKFVIFDDDLNIIKEAMAS